MIDLGPSEIELAIIEGIDRVLMAPGAPGWQLDERSGRATAERAFWRNIRDLSPLDPDEMDGSDISLLTVALICDRAGAALAATPLADHFTAYRLLHGLKNVMPIAADICSSAAESGLPVALAATAAGTGPAPLLSLAGGIAEWGVVFLNDTTIAAGAVTAGAKVPRNLADMPLAALPVDGWARMEVPAALLATACDERRILTAATIGGMTRRAMELGVEYAKEREQFGAPIGSFQAIAHGLADAKVAADSIEILSNKAAWAQRGEAARFGELARMAFAHASLAGARGVKFAMHVFGGYGNTPEYPIQAYFRSLRALTLAVGPAAADLRSIGRGLVAAEPALPFAQSRLRILEEQL